MKKVKPVISFDLNSIGNYYWKCPICGTWVGGFVDTYLEEDKLRYHQDKSCEKCDAKINWKR